MTQLLVLYDLRDGEDVAAYEKWTREHDTPMMLTLPAIHAKQVFRMAGQHGSADPSPYAYAELLDVGDLEAMGQQIEATAGATALVTRLRNSTRRLSFNVLEPIDPDITNEAADHHLERGEARVSISENVAIVEALYDAIDRDDHPAIHQLVDPDLSWEVLKNYPEGGVYRGADAVFEGDGFFPTLYTTFDSWHTLRDEHLDAGEQVVTLGRYQGRVIANGHHVDVPFAHTWTLRNGRITRMRQFTDTAEFVAAMAQPKTTSPEPSIPARDER